jgi:type I restriction-modification system DNA methylase subunit
MHAPVRQPQQRFNICSYSIRLTSPTNSLCSMNMQLHGQDYLYHQVAASVRAGTLNRYPSE